MSKLIDFTNSSWGHNYLGYGLCICNTNFENNDYFALIQKDEICIFKAIEVEKQSNPKDMYKIKKYTSIGTTENKEDLNIETIEEFVKSEKIEDKIIFEN